MNSSTALSVSVTRSVGFSFFSSMFEPVPAMRESTAALMMAPASLAKLMAKSRYSWTRTDDFDLDGGNEHLNVVSKITLFNRHASVKLEEREKGKVLFSLE